MEIPVYSPPGILDELTGKFRMCFGEIRQFNHFREMVCALDTTGRRSIAHLNSTIVNHVNQSSMNRFLSSHVDTDQMFRKTVELINPIEDDGILAIDDTIVQKTGRSMEGAGWIFDHSTGRTVWGMQFATSALSGRYGIYPVSALVYQRRENLEKEGRINEYRSKIEMQKSTIEKCISSGLHFSTVTGDIWYFTRDLIRFLNSKSLSWVFQSKGNRKIKIRGRWTTLDATSPGYKESDIMKISGNTYTVWEVDGKIRGMGNVKAIISEGVNGRRYYITNRTGWSPERVLETYLRRWDIEVMHRDLKQDGLGHIFLRKLCKTDLYLRLIVTGRVLLEISSIRSLNSYSKMDGIMELRKRWISFEFLESLFSGFKKYGYRFLAAMRKSITDPYRSARGLLVDHENLHKRGTI